MEITSTASTDAGAWLLAPVGRSGSPWFSKDGKPRRQADTEAAKKTSANSARPYLPAPEPGHVDFYA